MESVISSSMDNDLLDRMNIDLDDECEPRSLRECEEGLPLAIFACRKAPGFENAVNVCDFCRSLLAAHLRERGDAGKTRSLLEESLITVRLALNSVLADEAEQVRHFMENIGFRIQVVDKLLSQGEAAVCELIDQRQISLAQRLIQ